MNDHVVLSINGRVVYESDIGTRPDPVPTPAPTPTPTPVPNGMTREAYWRFAGIHGSDPEGIKSKFERYGLSYPEGFNWDDAIASGAFKATNSGSSPIKTGFELIGKGNWVRNLHHAGFTYRYYVPTVVGEQVMLQIAETVGTVDGSVTTSVKAPSGEVLSPQTTTNTRLAVHTFTSPGGRLIFYVMPSVTGNLAVQRN